MVLVVRDATARLAEPNYRPDYADTITGAVLTEASELRSLVDTDLLPPGTTLAAGDGAGQQLAHVLPDGRLYADGETYDSLLELSDALGLSGNPWTLWAVTRALEHGPSPTKVTTDRAAAYLRVLDEVVPAACHVTEHYANNPIEDDHGRSD
jgi:hypothetical protein